MAETFDARVKLLCLVTYIVAALHARTPAALAVCVAAAVAMGTAARLTPRDAAVAVRPLAAILVVTVVMQFLYEPDPATALAASAAMLVGLVCVMIASLAFMRGTPSDQLVATFDWLCGLLRALGVRTGKFMLALMVAFRFVPVLVDEFGQLKRAQIARNASFEGNVRDRLAAYARLFPPLVRSSFRRADRLADTFVARCFTGVARTTLHPQRTCPRDFALAAATAALVFAVFLI